MEIKSNWTSIVSQSNDFKVPLIETARLKVFHDPASGSLIATHFISDQNVLSEDYAHWWSELGEEYMASLKETRGRQARLILDALVSDSFQINSLLDFGAGPGWFLRICRDRGIANLVAADVSVQSLDALKKENFAVCQVTPTETGLDIAGIPDLRSVEVVTFLDVIEHFPAHLCESILSQLLSQLPHLKKIVIKVPNSSGLFFRISWLLAKMNKPGSLEQLFQVGTYPPHYQFFDVSSLKKLMGALKLEPKRWIMDPDFDPQSFNSRVRALSTLPKIVGRSLGYLFYCFARLTGWYDSIIVVAEIKRSAS